MHMLYFTLKLTTGSIPSRSGVSFLNNIEAQEIDWSSANITGYPNIAKRRRAFSKADWALVTAIPQPDFLHFCHAQ